MKLLLPHSPVVSKPPQMNLNSKNISKRALNRCYKDLVSQYNELQKQFDDLKEDKTHYRAALCAFHMCMKISPDEFEYFLDSIRRMDVDGEGTFTISFKRKPPILKER